MKVLSGAFRQNSAALPTWAALDQESLRLNSALEHVDRHGNLDRFSGIQSEKLALMTTANRQGLVRWNRNDSRYELTSLGRERLGAHRAVAGPTASAPPSRGSARDARIGVFGSGAAIATVVGVVVGAALMALVHGSSKMAPPNGAAVTTISEPSTGEEPASTEGRDPNGASARESHPSADAGYSSGVPCLSGTCPETGNSASAQDSVKTERQAPAPSTDQQTHLAVDAPGLASQLGIAPPSGASAHETPRPPASLRDQKTASRVPSQTAAHSAEASNPERTVPLAHPVPRRAGAGSKATRSIGRHAERAAGEPRASPGTSSKPVGHARSAAEPTARAKRDTDRTRPGWHEPQQTWGSAKTANVTRSGLLVREERKLADGTALVRYQYGNGPPRFEARGTGDRDWGRGYAYDPEHSRRAARPDRLFR